MVGDYVVLDSDIEQEMMVMKRDDQMGDLTKCDIMESLMGSKLYAHHAIQDSITVSDAEIENATSQRIEYFKSRLNNASDEELATYYRKENIQQLRDELNVINRDQLLANRMQESMTEDVQITP